MRQKSDISFANFLNRIRIGNHKDDDLNEIKKHLILQDALNYPKDALHVFSLNKQVVDHNLAMLQSFH